MWDRAYNTGTVFVSDVTFGDTPVGADFYWVGERGEQFGPFGVLHPFANVTGRGHFRCSDPTSNTNANAGRQLMNGGGFFEKYPHLLGRKMKKP